MLDLFGIAKNLSSADALHCERGVEEERDGRDASDVGGAGEAGEDAHEEVRGEVEEAGGRRGVWRGRGGGDETRFFSSCDRAFAETVQSRSSAAVTAYSACPRNPGSPMEEGAAASERRHEAAFKRPPLLRHRSVYSH